MDHSVYKHQGHDKHAGHHAEDFLNKFWVVLVLTIPIVLYSDLPEAFLWWAAPTFTGSTYLQALLGSIVFFYGGLVFLKGAWSEIKDRLPGMMTLIALAISAAYLYSLWVTFSGEGMALYWELSTLIAVMLIGHYIEMRAVQSAKGALRELANLLPDRAEVIKEGKKSAMVAISELTPGDIVLIRPGGKVPADGVILEGDSELNESLITGESKPVVKGTGAEVIAGSINGDGSLHVRIEKLGAETFLAGVMKLVAEAESSKSRLQLLSDRAAFYLTILAVAAGGATFAAWLVVGESFGFSVERLVAVLVIACPHALGLAIPLVASISTTMASRNGFFVKRRLALEAARNITTVLFDKTGTLTEGKFSVISASDEVVAVAAAVEQQSEHPIGKAIVDEAQKRGLSVSTAQQFKRLPGIGAEAMVDGRTVFVGHRGGVDIVVEVGGVSLGAIKLADTVRPEAREAVTALREMGVSVAMITGDSEEVAIEVAKELGIDEYFARVRPEDKSQKIKLLQSQGKKVAMVGDGVNDAPALTQADLGIAVGAGTNVAIEAAGIILVRNDPRDIPKIIRLSRLTYAKMIQNLFWASGYNILALPVAAGALATYGIMLQPAVAAIFMSLSTVVVAVNTTLLRRAIL